MKTFVFERSPQSLLDQREIALMSDRAAFGIAHSKNAQHNVVSPGKNISAQNI